MAAGQEVEEGALSPCFHLARAHKGESFCGLLGNLILAVARWALKWLLILAVIDSFDVVSMLFTSHRCSR